jgi:hypothetical protein
MRDGPGIKVDHCLYCIRHSFQFGGQRETSRRDSGQRHRPWADEYCTTTHVGFTIIVDQHVPLNIRIPLNTKCVLGACSLLSS